MLAARQHAIELFVACVVAAACSVDSAGTGTGVDDASPPADAQGWPESAAGSGAADGGAGTGGGGTAGAGGSLPCDPRFSFSANPPVAGVPFQASFTDSPGYVYVAMDVSGPGAPTTTWVGVSGAPHTWTYGVSGQGAGVLSFTFVKNRTGSSAGEIVGTCSVESLSEPP